MNDDGTWQSRDGPIPYADMTDGHIRAVQRILRDKLLRIENEMRRRGMPVREMTGKEPRKRKRTGWETRQRFSELDLEENT